MADSKMKNFEKRFENGCRKYKQVCPRFRKHVQIQLDAINTTSNQTGHRPRDDEFIGILKGKFLDGEFGRSVTCGVQLLDEEENG